MLSTGALAGTLYVMDDEPCYLIYEINRPAPDSKGVRRYRHIQVARGDKLAEYIEDLGPAGNFKGPEQQIVCGGVDSMNGRQRYWSEHTVAEAVDMCLQSMHHPWDYADVPHMGDKLWDAYHEAMDNKRRGNVLDFFTGS